MNNLYKDIDNFTVPGMIMGNFSKKFMKSLGGRPASFGLFTKKVKAIEYSGNFPLMDIIMKSAAADIKAIKKRKD